MLIDTLQYHTSACMLSLTSTSSLICIQAISWFTVALKWSLRVGTPLLAASSLTGTLIDICIIWDEISQWYLFYFASSCHRVVILSSTLLMLRRQWYYSSVAALVNNISAALPTSIKKIQLWSSYNCRNSHPQLEYVKSTYYLIALNRTISGVLMKGNTIYDEIVIAIQLPRQSSCGKTVLWLVKARCGALILSSSSKLLKEAEKHVQSPNIKNPI